MTVHQRQVAYDAIGHSANALRACLAHLKNLKNRRSLAVAGLVGLMCLGAATASTAQVTMIPVIWPRFLTATTVNGATTLSLGAYAIRDWGTVVENGVTDVVVRGETGDWALAPTGTTTFIAEGEDYSFSRQWLVQVIP